MGNFKTSILLLTLLSLSVFRCSDTVSPDYMDVRIIGEWYRSDLVQSDTLSPDITFQGIQINADRTIKLLGVEVNSGKIAVWKDNYEKITKVEKGKLIVEHFYYDLGPISQTYAYKIDNNKLILTVGDLDMVYTKTKLGNKLFEPVFSNLSLMFDTLAFENNKISFHTSAYVKKISPTEISLKAELDNSILRIDVEDINGTGSYEIPFGKGNWATLSGDVVVVSLSDSVAIGNITITQYDEINNICSGTFYFTLEDSYEPEFRQHIIKEGNFTVPIY